MNKHTRGTPNQSQCACVCSVSLALLSELSSTGSCFDENARTRKSAGGGGGGGGGGEVKKLTCNVLKEK